METTAPGHAYRADLGSGIDWRDDGRVVLLRGGERLAEGRHRTASAREFWATLGMLGAFPDVDYWWFGSPWTGRFRFSAPLRDRPTVSAGVLYGTIQFVDEEEDRGVWSIATAGPKLRVFTDLPPFHENKGVNLPLRRRLAEAVLAPFARDYLAGRGLAGAAAAAAERAVLADISIPTAGIAPDRWIATSSLCHRDALALDLPRRVLAWQLDQLADESPRDLLCAIQGLGAAPPRPLTNISN